MSVGIVQSVPDTSIFENEFHHLNRNNENAYGGGPEELIDVHEPTGKLGVVIDTPDGGGRVVHAVKDD